MVVILTSLLVHRLASAEIDLELRPTNATVEVGQTVNLELFAVSKTGQTMAGADVVLTWPVAQLELLGNDNTGAIPMLASTFPALDPFGLNATHNDGDALYVAFAQLGTPVIATPGGTLLTTFQFEALAVGSASVDMPRMYINGSETQVLDGDTPNLDVTGTLTGSTIDIIIDSCPEDFDDSGEVDLFDLLALIDAWGMCEPGCVGDVDHDGLVNLFDLLDVLDAWGKCPSLTLAGGS